MGTTQSSFITEFKLAFNRHFGPDILWVGGQSAKNCAAFLSPFPCRRAVGTQITERFELGDISTTYSGWKIIVEFENKQIPLSNILKYWPYMRGELSAQPEKPILLCHFSDWWSYATRRDLWEWTLSRMRVDPDRLVDIEGRQFDHGGTDGLLRASSILSAVAWIESVAHSSRKA